MLDPEAENVAGEEATAQFSDPVLDHESIDSLLSAGSKPFLESYISSPVFFEIIKILLTLSCC